MAMTHDELLAKIDLYQTETVWDIPEDSIRSGISKKNHSALRAVVELHKPKSSEYFDKDVCVACTPDIDTFAYHPCPTIQAIEKELG